jgi:hypothetical protein
MKFSEPIGVIAASFCPEAFFDIFHVQAIVRIPEVSSITATTLNRPSYFVNTQPGFLRVILWRYLFPDYRI